MRYRGYFHVGLAFFGLMMPLCATAQDGAVSLGDFARSLRKTKAPEAATIVDNDNLSKVIDDVEKIRLGTKPRLSFDGAGKKFEVSSPDGTCSLSFNANATALLTSPFVPQDLPTSELAKLDGPATIHDDTLELTVYNATAWNVKEITVGLTIARPSQAKAEYYGAAKLLLANAQSIAPTETQAERRPDTTLLLHLKGTAGPSETTIFREKLDASLNAGEPGQEWHWAIVEAKGTPPDPVPGATKDQLPGTGQ
jgi:hypothetical protein